MNYNTSLLVQYKNEVKRGLQKIYQVCSHKLRPHIIHESVSKIYNPMTPNDPYRGRTAPLTSKVEFYIFIQQI